MLPNVPHTDTLPASRELKEAMLNHLVSQLQALAKRVTELNEFIELDHILLHSMKKDVKEMKDILEVDGRMKVMDARKGLAKKSLKGTLELEAVAGEERLYHHAGSAMLEMLERLDALKRCKKAMEKSVIWLRDELKRVEDAMGLQPKISTDMDDESGKKWDRKTQVTPGLLSSFWKA
ncbi:hypothetical protein MMC09_000385 [Bachmanniomyces sp. S44760]|nr:hypothetical protein [Bachmanniomyces sp. S44760]